MNNKGTIVLDRERSTAVKLSKTRLRQSERQVIVSDDDRDAVAQAHHIVDKRRKD